MDSPFVKKDILYVMKHTGLSYSEAFKLLKNRPKVDIPLRYSVGQPMGALSS